VTPGLRVWVLLIVLFVLLLVSRSAPADEAIARRLAALKMLVHSTEAVPILPRAAASFGAPCGQGRAAWWRSTGYAVRSRIDTAVRDASLRFFVDPRLVHSVIRVESNYDIDAVSHAGAMGVMQLMPSTAADLGVACAFDPRENVLGGTRYLRALYERLGSWPRALAGYHAGPTNVERGRLSATTRRYVRDVMTHWRPHQRVLLSID
jgi:soluble lytic murein transglycosylase-like protein